MSKASFYTCDSCEKHTPEPGYSFAPDSKLVKYTVECRKNPQQIKEVYLGPKTFCCLQCFTNYLKIHAEEKEVDSATPTEQRDAETGPKMRSFCLTVEKMLGIIPEKNPLYAALKRIHVGVFIELPENDNRHLWKAGAEALKTYADANPQKPDWWQAVVDIWFDRKAVRSE